MELTKEIRNWKGKPKELVTCLTEKISSDNALFPKLISLLKTGSKVERGTCADVIKQLSITHPELVITHIDDLIEFVNYDAPRVKWGIPEAIGYLSKTYPEEASKAIPKLLINTMDESTVVRWCAAFALSEIALNCVSARESLVPKIERIAEAETNNGVRKVYLKALKSIKK